MVKPQIITVGRLNQIRKFATGFINYAENVSVKSPKKESERMKKFHDQLKLEKIPRVSPGMRFVDLVLVDTNPKDGELISESEKNPTKWGDWQHNGRVTDF